MLWYDQLIEVLILLHMEVLILVHYIRVNKKVLHFSMKSWTLLQVLCTTVKFIDYYYCMYNCKVYRLLLLLVLSLLLLFNTGFLSFILSLVFMFIQLFSLAIPFSCHFLICSILLQPPSFVNITCASRISLLFLFSADKDFGPNIHLYLCAFPIQAQVPHFVCIHFC